MSWDNHYIEFILADFRYFWFFLVTLCPVCWAVSRQYTTATVVKSSKLGCEMSQTRLWNVPDSCEKFQTRLWNVPSSAVRDIRARICVVHGHPGVKLGPALAEAVIPPKKKETTVNQIILVVKITEIKLGTRTIWLTCFDSPPCGLWWGH